jgi:Putative lumazine-binding
MTDQATFDALLHAIDRYFETMYDSDTSRFDQLFAPTAQLHGLRDGALRVLPVAEYRQRIASTASPKSKAAPRQQEILSIDFAAPTQALAKVRVRIDALLYLDYLSFHRLDERWLITAKSFHVERRFDDEAA